jgi:DnaJ family protein C protein 19|tara:strand:+ start:47058 stop:47552 length:495 start_codon:yes stop_codon:yes gene_type:complete
MLRIFFIALLITVWIVWWRWKNMPEGIERRQYMQKIIMWGLIAVIFLLAATGRIHWIGAIFAALLPALKFVFVWVLRLSPALAKIYSARTNTGSGSASTPTSTSAMDSAEAREILGVSESPTIEEVQIAFKRQMQKVHPDRGGSDYFATKLNEARDLLLKELNG